MKKLFPLLSCLLLTACASNSMLVPREVPGQKELARQAEDMLQNSPAIVKVPMPAGAFVLTEPEPGIPPELDTKIRHVEFFNADLQTILYSLAHQNIKMNFIYEAPQYPALTQNLSRNSERVVTPGSVTASSNISEQVVDKQDHQRLISISFNGKLSGFLKALSATSGYFFHYDADAGAIIVKEMDTFNVVIPNYTNLQKEKNANSVNFDMLEEVENNLKNLGSHNVSYDTLTSSLSFTADSNGFKRTKEYLKSLRENAALVTMQVMLLEVNLTNSKNAGIDWSKLVVGYKQQAQNPFGIAALNQQGSSSSGSSSSTSTTGAATSVTPLGTGLGTIFTGTGAELFVEAKNFSMSMLLNFLEQYGHYNIAQNIRIESMSGTKGKFEVLTETPYVSEVQFTALTQQSATATAGFKSATAKSGVEIEILPYYNKKDGSLSMALKVNVTGITQMMTLQAGQQFGTINQPQTTIKKLEDFLRITPSHIAIIGGLTYEKINNNSSGIPAESYLTKSYASSLEKDELVLVVKPTIYEFEPI